MKRLAPAALLSVLVAIGVACSGKPQASAPTAGSDAGTHEDSGVPATGPVAEDSGAADASPADASKPSPNDAGSVDATAPEGGGDDGGCEWGGAPGQCISTTACAAIADHTPYPNECPGPATIQCCIVTPSTADNPPVPAGWMLMEQAQVTSAMTTWAVDILDAPTTYPMFSTTTMTFGTLLVLARVEWHPPDFQNSVIHRGVTLYEPTD